MQCRCQLTPNFRPPPTPVGGCTCKGSCYHFIPENFFTKNCHQCLLFETLALTGRRLSKTTATKTWFHPVMFYISVTKYPHVDWAKIYESLSWNLFQ